MVYNNGHKLRLKKKRVGQVILINPYSNMRSRQEQNEIVSKKLFSVLTHIKGAKT